MKENLYYGFTKEQVNEFITKVFNYYNGRINTFNKCTLSINWKKSNSYGEFKFPNCVIINASEFLNFVNKEEFVENIIDAVICRLYRADAVDQSIEYCGDDVIWNHLVRYPAHKETAKYILTHIPEIIWLSDGIINADNFNSGFYDEQLLEFQRFEYIRRDMLNHVICTLTKLIKIKSKDGVESIYPAIYDAINSKNGYFTIYTLDNTKYVIIKNGEFACTVEEYNKMLKDMISEVKG